MKIIHLACDSRIVRTLFATVMFLFVTFSADAQLIERVQRLRDIEFHNKSIDRSDSLQMLAGESPIDDDASMMNSGRYRDSLILKMSPNQFIDDDCSVGMKDFALFRNVCRKRSWLTGLGEPITQEEANHLPIYYRFSMKNRAGNYQMLEILKNDSLPIELIPDFYIFGEDFHSVDGHDEWSTRLSKIKQCKFYSDETGINLIEERAYKVDDCRSELVYAMQVFHEDSIHVVLSFLDNWGHLVDMNEDVQNIYGSLVRITYDRKGCDSIVDYLDGAGYRKLNRDGVDQKQYKYDEKSRLILATSHNFMGDLATDDSGTCGVRYIYNDSLNIYSVIYLDDSLEPVRMSKARANDALTFVRCDCHLDEFGRTEETVILKSDGAPDQTLSGIHKIKYKYSDCGKLLHKIYLDKRGNELKNETYEN